MTQPAYIVVIHHERWHVQAPLEGVLLSMLFNNEDVGLLGAGVSILGLSMWLVDVFHCQKL